MKREYNKQSLDDKIKEAQDDVLRNKKKYEDSIDKLKALLEKKKAHEHKQLLEAFDKGNRTLEQVLAYLKG